MRESTRAELTVRGLIIGVVITLMFTAANVYFGLKAGLTFSTSIPAAVISMAILRGFRDATIQENNIVQTVASAAGTLSSIIFVLDRKRTRLNSSHSQISHAAFCLKKKKQ